MTNDAFILSDLQVGLGITETYERVVTTNTERKVLRRWRDSSFNLYIMSSPEQLVSLT